MTIRAVMAGVSLLVAAVSAPVFAEGRLAQLYAPRAPEGSAFIRVLQAGEQPLNVQVGRNPPQKLEAGARASAYNVVESGKSIELRIGDSVVGSLNPPAGSYQSVLLDNGKLVVLNDQSAGDDALKAELRFYNLVSDCPSAALAVENGPALFTDVAVNTSQARAINPVKANLSASCVTAKSQTLELPPLQPGDHYALFLTGSASQPTLHGELSRTAPFTR